MIGLNINTETVNPYDGLVLRGYVNTFHIKLRALDSGDAAYKRGTLLDLSSVDGKYVVHGTAAADAVDAVEAVYSATSDETVTAGKTYYTKSGSEYNAVTSPTTEGLSTYYELTTPASPAVPAEVLTANCILCDDTVIDNAGDVVALAYRTGEFSADYIRAATNESAGETVEINDTDKEALRDVGILLSDVFDA